MGCAGNPRDFFGFLTLPPFDHPRHLKSEPPENPPPTSPLGCRFNSAVTSQRGIGISFGSRGAPQVKERNMSVEVEENDYANADGKAIKLFSCPVVACGTGTIFLPFQASGGERESRATGWMLISSRVTRTPRSPRASRSPSKRSNITPLLQASPVDGCVKLFQRYSSLGNHL